MSSFKNKHILITGGASGIGFLMGRIVLNKQAGKLIIWDINSDKLRKVKEKFNQFSDKVHTYQVDVSDPDNIYQTAEQVLHELSHVDILINNAGIIVGKKFDQQTPQEIDDTIDLNLSGVMHTARAFLPTMLERNQGHIANIASAAGLMANPKMSVYAASKWGVIGWSESLRVELNQQKSNVHVTTIEPSYINTGMFAGVSPPLLTPILEAEDISKRIICAIEKNDIHLRAPFMVKLLPFLKGILPTKLFDLVAGNLFQVYHSMDTFTGRETETESWDHEENR